MPKEKKKSHKSILQGKKLKRKTACSNSAKTNLRSKQNIQNCLPPINEVQQYDSKIHVSKEKTKSDQIPLETTNADFSKHILQVTDTDNTTQCSTALVKAPKFTISALKNILHNDHTYCHTLPQFKSKSPLHIALNKGAKSNSFGLKKKKQIQNTYCHAARRSNALLAVPANIQDDTCGASRQLNSYKTARKRLPDTTSHVSDQLNSEFVDIEVNKDNASRFITRRTPNLRYASESTNSAPSTIACSNSNNKSAKQIRNTARHSKTRSDKTKKLAEQAVNTVRRANTRLNQVTRAIEQQRNTQMHQLRRHQKPYTTQLIIFNQQIKEGPVLICTCCGGLWFHRQVRPFNVNFFCQKFTDDFAELISTVPSNPAMICSTCYKHSCQGNVPKLSMSNGFAFPHIPPELCNLTTLEERLVAARIPFMIILSLGIDRQCGLRGNIVNVWNPINNLATVLPRRFSESSTVQLAFMRKMAYANPYICETIRPAVVYKAAKYLVGTPLYRQENIVLSEEWSTRAEADTVDFIADPEDAEQIETFTNSNQMQDATIEDNSMQDNEENLEEIPAEEITMFHEDNINIGIRYAPGEGQTPMSLLFDLNAELLSFPSIYAGQERVINPTCKASYADIVRSESRRFDRRSCTPVHLLYQYKRLQIYNIHNAINISLRKKKLGTVTASEMLRSDYVNNLVQHDDGFRFLRGIKSTPAYWENQQKKVMAMIRQLGIPTFFVTLSAAESRWQDLIIILAKVLDDKILSETDVEEMTFADKNAYIRRDPVTCARYFDHRFRCLYNHLLGSGAVFEEYSIVDFYWRIEFQHRGSPHVHMILWLLNAPVYNHFDDESAKTCSAFIDRFITCENDDVLATYQSHKHSFTCRKTSRGEKICRFGIPIPPMRTTIVLEPHKDRTKSQKKVDSLGLEKIKSTLVTVRQQRLQINFDEFLKQLEMDDTEYEDAIRSGIKRNTVFLKRSPSSAFINAYNRRIETAWKANMDIQFILDPYACARYVVQYINKSCRGVSKLIRKAAEDIRRGNISIRDKLRTFGNCITNGTELSAQEAAYGVLGMQMVLSSRADTFIPTSIPEERVFLIKSDAELAKLDQESTNIAVLNVLDHYINRPEELAETCLASFCAWYEYQSRKKTTGVNESYEAETSTYSIPNAFGDENRYQQKLFTLLNGKGYLRRRGKAKIIRFRNYSEHVDLGNFCREQCMLYLPWRNEDSDLLNIDCEQLYKKYLKTIQTNKEEFQPTTSFDLVIELEKETQQSEDEDENDEVRIDHQNRSFFDTATSVNAFQNEQNTEGSFARFPVPARVSDSDYLDLASTLNCKQRQYFTHIMRQIRSNTNNVCEFVSGGAGVGKTHLIKTIVQWVIRHQLSLAGVNPLLPPVLLCAPTGKAAFHIRGMTLHAAFCLPLNQTKLGSLDFSKLNTLRTNMQNIKLIIMDEVSMCSSRMLQFIDSRLQQIFETKEPFGGKYFLCLGDLHQLRPVGGSYVFHANSDDVGVIAGAYPWHLFKFFELTQIMRQDNKVFAQALNNLAIGNLSEEETLLFKSRKMSATLYPSPEVLQLFNSNLKVDNYNTMYLTSLQSQAVLAEATDLVLGSMSATSRAAILKAAQQKPTKDTLGLPQKILLKIGAKYMITNNLDTADGIVNGATGVLTSIQFGLQERNKATRVPILLLLDFQDPDVGKKARCSYQLQGGLTPVSPIVREIHKWPSNNLSVHRRQFPVVPAHALTFWKAQGMTYDSVVVNTSCNIDRQQLYVACSRVTSLEGLYINGEFVPPRKPRSDDPVETELARLRTDSAIRFHFADIPQTCDTRIKIMFHNVQSFLKHKQSIVANQLYTQCEILLFAEPKVTQTDVCDIINYKCVYRYPTTTDRRASTGLLVFAKHEINISVELSLIGASGNKHAELVVLKLGSLIIILGYKSPRMSVASFQELISICICKFINYRILVVGDFNINANRDSTQNFLTRLLQQGLMTAIPRGSASNQNGTLIDYCVSNDPDINAQFTESTFSYHRPMIVSVRRE